jgi:hypothetical protein
MKARRYQRSARPQVLMDQVLASIGDDTAAIHRDISDVAAFSRIHERGISMRWRQWRDL